MNNDLATKIIRWGNEIPFGDLPFFGALLETKEGAVAFLDAAYHTLTTEPVSNADFSAVNWALREAAIARISFGNAPDIYYHDIISAHPIVDVLLSSVNGRGLGRRYSALYTFDKVHIYSAIPRLYDIFQQRLHRDPFLISDMIHRIHWREIGLQQEDLQSQAVQSPSFWTRWCLLEHGTQPTIHEPLPAYLTTLTHDSHPLVRAEAQFVAAEWEIRKSLWDIGKGEGRSERRRDLKVIRRENSALIQFGTLVNLFLNAKSETDGDDYTIADLDAYLESLIVKG